jgi:hypothetical protein
MTHIAQGASLSGLAGRIVAEVVHEDEGNKLVILKGEVDGIKLDETEAKRLAAFLTGGEQAVFEYDENDAKEHTPVSEEGDSQEEDEEEPESEAKTDTESEKPASLKPRGKK